MKIISNYMCMKHMNLVPLCNDNNIETAHCSHNLFHAGVFCFFLFIQLVWWLLCILGTLKQNLYTRKCAHFTPCFCQSRCYWPYDEYSWNLTKIRCSIFGQTLNTCRCDHLPKIDCNQSKIFICILNGK